MNYTQSLQYLNSFLNFEKISKFSYRREFNLARFKTALGWFGNTERHFHSILIAGTKGKGSSAFFMERLLSSRGFRVGLYTSPHFSDFRERIRIGTNLISKPELAKLTQQIKIVMRRNEHNLRRLGPLTFFEVTTLLAFLYFSKKKVDWAVLEVGMGGRLDATNVVSQSLSIMTLIGLDHQEHLGNTISEIAREKAGIIKLRAPVVCAAQPKAAFHVIQSRAKAKRAPLHVSGRDFRAKNVVLRKVGSQFDFESRMHTIQKIKLSLPGSFQVKNASLALASFLILSEKFGFAIKEQDVRHALAAGLWPGRFEQVRRNGLVFILDSAHNPESFQALSANLKEFYKHKKIVTILGLSREKDLEKAYSIIGAISDTMIMTKANQPRARSPKNMIENISVTKNQLICNSLIDAIEIARKMADQNSIILITGSLFLVGEARKALRCKMPF